MTILTLRNVSKVFANPDNGTDQVHAIESVSLEVQSGEFFSIIGPSGCGKSTLLRIIGGLLPASAGELTVGTERVYGPHSWIGMVFQEESTFPWRTTLANGERKRAKWFAWSACPDSNSAILPNYPAA